MNWKFLLLVLLFAFAAMAWVTGLISWPTDGKVANTPIVQPPSAAAPQPMPKFAPPVAIPVLMYHSISQEKGNDAVISKERFAEQMAFLHQHNYRPISMDELYDYLGDRGDLPSKPVVITFDDGYRDTYEVALPILKQYGFKSVMFIIAAQSSRHISWQELKEMKDAGMEIGSHSFTHRDLGTLSPAEQAEEIGKSKEMLDSLLRQDTRYFCYPNGSYNQATLNLLREKGYRLAVTIDPGWVKPGDEPLTLRRVWMGNAVDLKHFEERITRQDYSIL